MRQKLRRVVIYVSLLLFPLSLNYFSPYVSVDGAFQGIVSGSIIVFLLMLLTGVFFRRLWCAWICPVAGLSELCSTINHRTVNIRRLRRIRYTIFAVWFAVLITGFTVAGGISMINPFHLTDRAISVDEPIKYITYYLVLFILFGLTVGVGRRGACHAICWMSPFLVAGTWIGKILHLPQLRIKANPTACIDCMQCNRKCPMSLDVNAMMKTGGISSTDCIQCGECVDVCPKMALSFSSR